jgi:hypothetical protein
MGNMIPAAIAQCSLASGPRSGKLLLLSKVNTSFQDNLSIIFTDIYNFDGNLIVVQEKSQFFHSCQFIAIRINVAAYDIVMNTVPASPGPNPCMV